jgi:UDP:flavonoid glycosyltransferase YjiC (YdhE family)
MLRAAVDSLADKPVRIALTLPRTDWAGPTPPNAVVVGFTPHTPILERSILCISQAGHGIVSKCLIHGVPMVLMPWDADQPGVAARAGALGVAAVIGRDRATPEAVSVAVDDILNTPSHLMTARSIAATIASRSPIETAVSHLEALASVSA